MNELKPCLTLENAIEHAKEEAAKLGDCVCAAEHAQLAAWLEELVDRRAQPDNARFAACHIWEPGDKLDTISDKCDVLIKAADIKALMAHSTNEPPREKYLRRICAERDRQDAKWGYPQENTYCEWSSILAEETGELAEQLNELNFGRGDLGRMEEEATHVAAVALSILEQQLVAHQVTAQWLAYRRKPDNAPLTLAELRGMDGETVRVVYDSDLIAQAKGERTELRYGVVKIGYAITPVITDDVIRYDNGKCLSINYHCGTTYLAYRRKPEGGDPHAQR